MKKNEFAVVLASDNRGILPLSVTVFSLLNTAGPDTFYKVYILSDGIDAGNRGKLEELAAPFDCRLEFIEISNILEEHDFPPYSTVARTRLGTRVHPGAAEGGKGQCPLSGY